MGIKPFVVLCVGFRDQIRIVLSSILTPVISHTEFHSCSWMWFLTRRPSQWRTQNSWNVSNTLTRIRSFECDHISLVLCSHRATNSSQNTSIFTRVMLYSVFVCWISWSDYWYHTQNFTLTHGRPSQWQSSSPEPTKTLHWHSIMSFPLAKQSHPPWPSN